MSSGGAFALLSPSLYSPAPRIQQVFHPACVSFRPSPCSGLPVVWRCLCAGNPPHQGAHPVFRRQDADGDLGHRRARRFAIGLMPSTRLMYETKADATAIKPGDSGRHAQQKRRPVAGGRGACTADALKSRQGFYPLPSGPDQRILTGQVTKNDLATAQVTVAFRGSVGSDGPTCTGRAPRTDGCKGELTFALPAKVPVVAIMAGDKSILAPGKVAAISVIAGADGHLVTPGLTIENETGGEVLNVMPKPAKPEIIFVSGSQPDAIFAHPSCPCSSHPAGLCRRQAAIRQFRASISPRWIRASSRATISSIMSMANG